MVVEKRDCPLVKVWITRAILNTETMDKEMVIGGVQIQIVEGKKFARENESIESGDGNQRCLKSDCGGAKFDLGN